MPANKHICEAINIIDGLTLSGGGDIDGYFLGQPTHEMATDIWPTRDEAEINIVRLAYERDMPILGICRGLQVLNVALGGDIVQHIEGHKQAEARNVPTHSVKISGQLTEIIGVADIMVNSIHHQAAGSKVPTPHLQVCGVAPDDVIEAICAPGKRFVVGIQWHPEELIHISEHFRIFEEFMVSILYK